MKTIFKNTFLVSRQGFTLTEIALVLGIIGLILSVIWGGASKVYDTIKINKAISEVDAIIQNARNFYGNSYTFDPGVLTTAFVAGNIFPSDTVSGGIPFNPWHTTSTISSTPGAGIDVGSQVGWGGCPHPATSLQIVFWGLPQQQSISMLAHYIGSSHTDVDCIYADCLGTRTDPSSLTVNQLLNACNSAPGVTTNIVISVTK